MCVDGEGDADSAAGKKKKKKKKKKGRRCWLNIDHNSKMFVKYYFILNKSNGSLPSWLPYSIGKLLSNILKYWICPC